MGSIPLYQGRQRTNILYCGPKQFSLKGVLRLYPIALNSNIFESTSVRSCLQVVPGYLLESKEHYRCKLSQSQLFSRSSRSIHDEKRKAVNHSSLNKIYVT